MKTFTLYIIVLIVILSSNSCFWMMEEEEEYRELTYINNSDSTLLIISNFGQIADTNITERDAKSLKWLVFDSNRDYSLYPHNQIILGVAVSIMNEDKELLLIKTFSKTYPLNYSTEEIVEKQMKLSSKAYTLSQLDSLNWTITYP